MRYYVYRTWNSLNMIKLSNIIEIYSYFISFQIYSYFKFSCRKISSNKYIFILNYIIYRGNYTSWFKLWPFFKLYLQKFSFCNSLSSQLYKFCTLSFVVRLSIGSRIFQQDSYTCMTCTLFKSKAIKLS